MENKILMVEDDLDICNMVEIFLKNDGFNIHIANNGKEGLEALEKEAYALILLDLMMPEMDGMTFLKKIREEELHTPVLIMSAKNTEVDKAMGLGFGADDFIAKPFSMIELSARVKAIIRRATKYSGSLLPKEKEMVFGELRINTGNYTVFKGTEELKLTSTEFELLRLFAASPTQVFTKAQIYKAVWKEEYFGDENVINVHIRRLREKVEDDPSTPKWILTVWGIGYKFGESQ